MLVNRVPAINGECPFDFLIHNVKLVNVYNNTINTTDIGGLGEVMDFNGVAAGEENIIGVIESAANRGAILDGHASALTGDRLQAFRAVGIDSDHTVPIGEKLLEELALGFTVQAQESMLSEEMVKAMNEASVRNRSCLVTDDVPLPRLMNDGHLNHVASKAISLGLDPVKAVKYTTINPAERMRLYALGGSKFRVMATMVVQELNVNFDWGAASAISYILMAVILLIQGLIVLATSRYMKRMGGGTLQSQEYWLAPFLHSCIPSMRWH